MIQNLVSQCTEDGYPGFPEILLCYAEKRFIDKARETYVLWCS